MLRQRNVSRCKMAYKWLKYECVWVRSVSGGDPWSLPAPVEDRTVMGCTELQSNIADYAKI